MVLDTATLRFTFGLMALGLALLFYFSAYRATRPVQRLVVPVPHSLLQVQERGDAMGWPMPRPTDH